MHFIDCGIFLLYEPTIDRKTPKDKDYCKYAVHYRHCEKQKIGTGRECCLIERDAQGKGSYNDSGLKDIKEARKAKLYKHQYEERQCWHVNGGYKRTVNRIDTFNIRGIAKKKEILDVIDTYQCHEGT